MILARQSRLVATGCISVLCLMGCARHRPDRTDLNKQLIAASEKGDLVAGSRLLGQGADVNAEGPNGFTPLILAAEEGNTELVKLLLSAGADSELKIHGGETALTSSLMGDNPRIISLLLGQHPSQPLLNKTLFDLIQKRSALAVAVYEGANGAPLTPAQLAPDPVVTLLVEKGANLNARDVVDGSTPLEEAASLGQLTIVKASVADGANLEAKDKYGDTPLLAAACDCAQASMPDTDDVVEFLLERGADVNARNNEGDTALMIASGGGVVKSRIVKILLAHGASVRLRNKKGETALMIAEHDRVTDVVQMLRTARNESL